ncbi:DUF1153 domain-containing protein [Sphingomonas cavernae]|uniref:DUF1153 domain-containing protein n=1 Tax=Sphingomonas cavernae TaxID=2320861 RepID=UPI0016008494
MGRWTGKGNAHVAHAVLHARLTVDDACCLYRLSEVELGIWCRAYSDVGVAALRTTKAQCFDSIGQCAPTAANDSAKQGGRSASFKL